MQGTDSVYIKAGSSDLPTNIVVMIKTSWQQVAEFWPFLSRAEQPVRKQTNTHTSVDTQDYVTAWPHGHLTRKSGNSIKTTPETITHWHMHTQNTAGSLFAIGCIKKNTSSLVLELFSQFRGCCLIQQCPAVVTHAGIKICHTSHYN